MGGFCVVGDTDDDELQVDCDECSSNCLISRLLSSDDVSVPFSTSLVPRVCRQSDLAVLELTVRGQSGDLSLDDGDGTLAVVDESLAAAEAKIAALTS